MASMKELGALAVRLRSEAVSLQRNRRDFKKQCKKVSMAMTTTFELWRKAENRMNRAETMEPGRVTEILHQFWCNVLLRCFMPQGEEFLSNHCTWEEVRTQATLAATLLYALGNGYVGKDLDIKVEAMCRVVTEECDEMQRQIKAFRPTYDALPGPDFSRRLPIKNGASSSIKEAEPKSSPRRHARGFLFAKTERRVSMNYYMEDNDHRKIGQELDLFTFSELVGPGLPLWTPRGTVLREELDKFVWELRSAYGYSRVAIPHITKKELYETSGHWDKFSDDLFRITSRDGREMALKPMNCPHHTQIFARRPHSYREMPQRYAETTMVYRDEQSGELSGLTRVLSITQDDSHVFCRTGQIKEEFLKIWDVVDTFYKQFGFTLRVRLSFRDPATPEKYIGTPAVWDMAEKQLREIAEERGADYIEGPGEAALYGPKLDFIAKSASGREWQVATIQLDLNQPERFDLYCINEKGEKERIVMIHSAITGSIERCVAVLLEHLEGVLPTWLSPVQARVLPIGEGHLAFAQQAAEQLKAAGIRAELDDSNESLGKKIRAAKTLKVPYLLVIGDQEVAAQTATLEGRVGKLGAFPIAEIISKLQEEIKTRA